MPDETRHPHDALAAALKATVVARQQPDGSWLCECGESCPTDLLMYRHRQSDPLHRGDAR